MGKSNNPANKSKPRVKVSVLHLIVILAGANCIMLFAPNIGMLNSFLYIPDIYTWPASALGIAMLYWGFRGLYRQQ